MADAITGMQLSGFDTWQQVLQHVRAEYPLWYQAPLDRRPTRVHVVRVYLNGKIRLAVTAPDVDDFTADPGHLSRMRRDYSRVRLIELQKAGHDVSTEGGD